MGNVGLLTLITRDQNCKYVRSKQWCMLVINFRSEFISQVNKPNDIFFKSHVTKKKKNRATVEETYLVDETNFELYGVF